MTWGLRAALSASLVAFGISDVIELNTGAWWRPPGLLVYKGICLASIVSCGILIQRKRRQRVDVPPTEVPGA